MTLAILICLLLLAALQASALVIVYLIAKELNKALEEVDRP